MVESLYRDLDTMFDGMKSAFEITFSHSRFGKAAVYSSVTDAEENDTITLLGHIGDIEVPACDVRGEMETSMMLIERRLDCHIAIDYRDGGNLFKMFASLKSLERSYKEFADVSWSVKMTRKP